MPLRTIVEVAGGTWIAADPVSVVPALEGALIAEISTDTRTIPPASVFVALKGDRFDGHSHIAEARRKGALASVVSRSRIADLPLSGGPYICVDDPLDALERLAIWNRGRLHFTVVAITGSVGKTSTKEFLATVLSDAFRVRCAPKSFNNRLGVATTLISANPDTEVLVAELGTSAPGEISRLTRAVRPHRIVLTEIAPAHLEGFGDLDGVVRAKAEIFEGLEPGGRSFLRHGVHGFERFLELSGGSPVTFGWGAGDLAVTACQRVTLGCDRQSDNGRGDYGYLFTLNGEQNFLLPVPGRHNVLNATAAIAVARDLGLRWEGIRSALSNCRLPPLRLEVRDRGGIVFVDDSYNASPLSMEAAIEEWASLANGRGGNGRDHSGSPREAEAGDGGEAGECRVAVLGDMLELGRESRRLHEDLGRTLARVRPRLLVTVGHDSRWIGESCREVRGAPLSPEVVHFSSAADAAAFLKGRLREGDHVLFKGSRRIGLDAAVAELERWLSSRAAPGCMPNS